MNILVLGASGMIGRTMFRVLSQHPEWAVTGSIRANNFQTESLQRVIVGSDLCNLEHIVRLFRRVRPNVVVNCAGLTKHVPEGGDPLAALTINSLLPHRLAEQCAIAEARLIHISTDCVFSGSVGNYLETDLPDAVDVYGRTKALGEVFGDNIITLRTSTIGHEHATAHGLLEWFLSQEEKCKGFRHAIFSGLPSVEFARIVRDLVIPNLSLSGLYHVGGAPIDKLSLLRLIAEAYGKKIQIEEQIDFRINRSLSYDKFSKATGYQAAAWPELIEMMHQDYLSGK